MPAFPSWHSPYVTTTATEAADIQLQLTTHLSTPKVSWPSWLTYSGWLTDISGHPSATSRAQDSESTSAKEQCSTAGPRHQLPKVCTLAPPGQCWWTVRAQWRRTFMSNYVKWLLSLANCLLSYVKTGSKLYTNSSHDNNCQNTWDFSNVLTKAGFSSMPLHGQL